MKQKEMQCASVTAFEDLKAKAKFVSLHAAEALGAEL
jgi:hypothetical protein